MMGLGNFDMASFKPQRSGTAAALLTTSFKQEEKKSERLELRIRSDVLLLFKEICEARHTNVSEAIRTFISGVVSLGAIDYKTAVAETSVQNVRTKECGSIEKRSNGSINGGKVTLRNKAEREEWLKNFKEWGVWLDIPELQMEFYRYDFINGSSLIIAHGKYYYESYKEIKLCDDIRYSLLDGKRSGFDCCGISFSNVIEWLTRHSKEI